MLSITALLLLVSLPVWGALSDRLRSGKKVLVLMAGTSTLILMCIPCIEGALPTAIAVCLLAVFESGFVSMMDGFVVQTIEAVPGASFGKIRIWGAAGAVTALSASGLLLNRLQMICWVYAGALCLVVFLLSGVSENTVATTPKPRKISPVELLRSRTYVAFVLFVGVLFIPFRFTQSFLVSIIEGVGGNSNMLQFALLAGSFSEGLFYILSSRMARRMRPLTMALIAGAFFILRQALFFVSDVPAQAIYANLTLGPSFGLMTAAAVQYVFEISPSHLKASAQAVANAIIYGVSGIISNVLGGWLLDRMGASNILGIGALISGIAFTMYIIFLYSLRRTEKCIDRG